jgi:hypothetical protein
MPFIPTLNCVQARLQYQSLTGVFAENVFYHACPGVPLVADLEAIGEVYKGWVPGSLISGMTNNWQVTSVALRAMNEAEGISLLVDDTFPFTGDISGSPEPLSVTYTVTWSTGLVGRSARGRTYGVGLAREYIVNWNRLNDLGQAALNGRWNELRTRCETDGHALQVVSFQEALVPRTEGRTLPILNGTVRFPLASQRRRLA